MTHVKRVHPSSKGLWLTAGLLLGMSALAPAAVSQKAEETIIKSVANEVKGGVAGKTWKGDKINLQVVRLLKRIQIKVRVATLVDGQMKTEFEPLKDTRVHIRNYDNGKLLVNALTDENGFLPDKETQKIGVGNYSLRPVTSYPKEPYYYASNFALAASDRDKELNLVTDYSSVVFNVLSGKPLNGAKVGLHRDGGDLVNGPFDHYAGSRMNPIPMGVQMTGGAMSMNEPPRFNLYQGEFQYKNPDLVISAQSLRVKALVPEQKFFVSVDFEPGSGLEKRFNPVERTQAPWGGYEQPYRGQEFKLLQDQPIGLQVPLIPISALKVTKMANKTRAQVGDIVAYRVKVENTSEEDTNPVQPIIVVDQMPVGIKYLRGTARLNGQPVEPVIAGNTLRFSIGALKAKGAPNKEDQNSVVYMTTLATSVVAGQVYENRALAQIQGITVSNVSSAAIRVDSSPFADEALLIGKVYIDANGNGWQDEGEQGVGGVRLVMEDGTTIITDPDGKYSVPQVTPGRHVIKLDESSLPFGLAPASNPSRFLLISRGLIAKQNFALRETKDEAPNAHPAPAAP
jgi:uncharacterized repeat protein (TIGR01451 family)